MADTLANTKLFIFWASDPIDCWKVRAAVVQRGVRDWVER